MRRKASTTPSTPQAVAYVRVSTPGQRDEGVSLDAQRSKIAAWCEVMGYELVADVCRRRDFWAQHGQAARAATGHR